mmetsp:Transcript_90241/g.269245  ORF Transcript_90241/g.269245 Transcript_90241/m.269245 type:complete len:282 (+) Transcript_90241:53-898(+)
MSRRRKSPTNSRHRAPANLGHDAYGGGGGGGEGIVRDGNAALGSGESVPCAGSRESKVERAVHALQCLQQILRGAPHVVHRDDAVGRQHLCLDLDRKPVLGDLQDHQRLALRRFPQQQSGNEEAVVLLFWVFPGDKGDKLLRPPHHHVHLRRLLADGVELDRVACDTVNAGYEVSRHQMELGCDLLVVGPDTALLIHGNHKEPSPVLAVRAHSPPDLRGFPLQGEFHLRRRSWRVLLPSPFDLHPQVGHAARPFPHQLQLAIEAPHQDIRVANNHVPKGVG